MHSEILKPMVALIACGVAAAYVQERWPAPPSVADAPPPSAKGKAKSEVARG